MKVYVISDSHFGLELDDYPDKRRRKLFFEFLDKISKDSDLLVLLGDIFDFWFEYGHVIPKIYFDILRNLSKFAQDHRVVFIGGNHDMWADGFFKEMGIEVYPCDFELEIEEKRVFLAHGDVLRKTDLGGRLTRLIMGNRVSKFLYRLIHPDVGIALANFVSKRSRVRSLRHEIKNPVNPTVKEILRDGYDAVIHGHIHYPYIEKFENGIFMSTGDWLWHFTYGVLSEEGISLNYHLSGKSINVEW